MSECFCTGQEQVQKSGKFWCECHQTWKHAHWKKLCEQSEKYRDAWADGRGPGQIPKPKKKGLGDYVASTLQAVGITPERYVAAKGAVGLKKKCRCKERQEALNKLGQKIGIG